MVWQALRSSQLADPHREICKCSGITPPRPRFPLQDLHHGRLWYGPEQVDTARQLVIPCLQWLATVLLPRLSWVTLLTASVRACCRAGGVAWGTDDLALVYQSWWKTRQSIISTIRPGSPEEGLKVLFDRCAPWSLEASSKYWHIIYGSSIEGFQVVHLPMGTTSTFVVAQQQHACCVRWWHPSGTGI